MSKGSLESKMTRFVCRGTSGGFCPPQDVRNPSPRGILKAKRSTDIPQSANLPKGVSASGELVVHGLLFSLSLQGPWTQKMLCTIAP